MLLYNWGGSFSNRLLASDWTCICLWLWARCEVLNAGAIHSTERGPECPPHQQIGYVIRKIHSKYHALWKWIMNKLRRRNSLGALIDNLFLFRWHNRRTKASYCPSSHRFDRQGQHYCSTSRNHKEFEWSCCPHEKVNNDNNNRNNDIIDRLFTKYILQLGRGARGPYYVTKKKWS